MKRIIAATALTLMMSTSAIAASHTMGTIEPYATEQKGDFYAADFIGKELYTTDQEFDRTTTFTDGWQDNWENIGQVENVILNQDGTVKAVILEVGGWLDIGDKHVAVPMENLSFIRDESSWDNYFVAVKTNREELEAMPAFEEMSEEDRRAASDGMQDDDQTAMNNQNDQADNQQMTDNQDGQVTDEQMAETQTDDTMADDDTVTSSAPATFRRPDVQREGYLAVEARELTADRLKSANLYSVNDEDIGEIGELILTQDGEIESVVLDIGGFIGLGEHHFAVSFDEIQIIRDEDWGDVRVYIDASKEELEARPEYDG